MMLTTTRVVVMAAAVEPAQTDPPTDWVEYTHEDGRRYRYSASHNVSEWLDVGGDEGGVGGDDAAAAYYGDAGDGGYGDEGYDQAYYGYDDGYGDTYGDQDTYYES